MSTQPAGLRQAWWIEGGHRYLKLDGVKDRVFIKDDSDGRALEVDLKQPITLYAMIGGRATFTLPLKDAHDGYEGSTIIDATALPKLIEHGMDVVVELGHLMTATLTLEDGAEGV